MAEPLCVKPLELFPVIFPVIVNAPVLPMEEAEDKLSTPDRVVAEALLFRSAPAKETPVPFK